MTEIVTGSGKVPAKTKTGRPKGSKDKAKRVVGGDQKKKAGAAKPARQAGVDEQVGPFPRNLEFERKLGGLPASLPAEENALAVGVTETLDRKIVADCLKLPFAFWASKAGLPAVRLTDREAKEFAEPVAPLIEHYLPTIPPMAYAWLGTIVVFAGLMNSRFELIAAAREKSGRSSAGSASQASAGQPATGRQPVIVPFAQGAPKYEPKKV